MKIQSGMTTKSGSKTRATTSGSNVQLIFIWGTSLIPTMNAMSLLISLMVVAPVAALHRVFTLARSEHHIVRLERRAQLSSGGLKFAFDCTSYLLSSDSIEDGIISQDEFTSFLSESCRSDGLCGASEEYEFERLSFDLQLRFVRGVCPFDNIGARIDCIEGLEAMWLDSGLFGFRISEDGHESLVESVESMCTEAYEDAIKMGLTGTLVQTSNPSMIETAKPSNAATTEFPSPKPSPTSNPSMIETTKPSNAETTEFPSPKPSPPASTVSTLIPTSTSALYTPPPSSDENHEEVTESPLPIVNNRPTPRPNLFKEPTTFVEECHQIFVGDCVVSQVEFTDFVANRCRAEGLCDDEFKLSFEQFDVSLQLDFILGACGEDMKDCTDEYGQFGFDAGAESIETSVSVLCSSAFEHAILMGLATTSAPMPTNKPTNANTSSEMPSSNPSFRHDGVLFAPTEKKPLGPNKRAFIGVSAAAVLLLMTAGGALAYARSNSFDKKSLPDGRNSNGAINYVPWERHSPFPFSVPSSCSSSSSSFRDCRFVRLTGPGGQSIAQFDPNTASAVVIGSVTIGNGGSSSISTGPSKEYITIGQVGSSKQRAKSDASSSGLSSVSSSEHSTAAKNGYRLGWYGFSSSSKAASRDLSNSTMSRCTMPMTQARTAQFERVHYENTISFVDWKAASHVTSVTDTAAAQKQRQFFFDLYTSVLSSSSGSNQVSTYSLGVGGRCESELKHVAIPPSGALVSSPDEMQEVLVPWRRGGFSGAFRTSDGKQSEESESSRSFYIEQWPSKDLLSSKQISHTHPVRSLFKRAKVMMQRWFKHKQYQNLNGRLHEDLSVISMQSYSSNMNIQLLPNPRSSEAFGLPGLILGTWAAATIPIEAVRRSHDIEAALDTVTTDCGVSEAQSKKEQMTTSSNAPLGRSAILGIQRRDNDNGSSGLESSTGWSTSSIRHGSSCSSTTWDNENNTSHRARVMDVHVSHISEGDSAQESSLELKTEGFKLVSPRCASLNITPDSNKTNAELRTMSTGLVNPDDEPSPSNPKALDSNFFMMLANDIHADASSVEQSTPRFSGDWSHNISDSTESSESASVETDDNDNSLSLSLESEGDSASQALEWAIAQEVSKKINPSCSSTIISIPKE